MSRATQAFLDMLAAERGAAPNTLAAYRRDLDGAEDVLGETGAWTALKRVLRNGRLEIQPKESALGMAPLQFQPEAIPLEGKVILACDQNPGSFVTAVSKKHGKLIWKTERSHAKRLRPARAARS